MGPPPSPSSAPAPCTTGPLSQIYPRQTHPPFCQPQIDAQKCSPHSPLASTNKLLPRGHPRVPTHVSGQRGRKQVSLFGQTLLSLSPKNTTTSPICSLPPEKTLYCTEQGRCQSHIYPKTHLPAFISFHRFEKKILTALPKAPYKRPRGDKSAPTDLLAPVCHPMWSAVREGRNKSNFSAKLFFSLFPKNTTTPSIYSSPLKKTQQGCSQSHKFTQDPPTRLYQLPSIRTNAPRTHQRPLQTTCCRMNKKSARTDLSPPCATARERPQPPVWGRAPQTHGNIKSVPRGLSAPGATHVKGAKATADSYPEFSVYSPPETNIKHLNTAVSPLGTSLRNGGA